METTTFYNLIAQKIQIPSYQRDYAHGRSTPQAGEIRKNLIEKFAQVLSSLDKTMSFDFIYGYNDGDCFIPVDGQQRLTTLFLLHLFLSKKANDSDIRLSNFSYATRQFTREFCEKISAPETHLWTDAISPQNFIPDQEWFYSQWRKDPSIMGMIRVLDQIYNCFSEKDCKKCWERLKNDAAITFGIPDQSRIGSSPKTYLKMNSRYLSLDNFENFKAHFEKYLSSKELTGIPIGHRAACDDWEKMAFYKKVIWKIDKDWSNYFWNKKETDFSACFMSVIARIFSCFAVLNGNEKNRCFFEELADGTKNFVSFSPFEETLRGHEKKYLGLLFSFLDNLSDPSIEMEFLVNPSWGDEKFDFLSPDNDKTRVVFGGALLFGEFTNKSDFAEWMRVVWNIAANTSDLKALQTFEKLADEKQNLLAFMANRYKQEQHWLPGMNDVTLLECQFNHEYRKAKIITDEPEKKQQILNMEKDPFFHGDISVQLFGTADPAVWESRNRKLEAYPQDNCAFLKDLLLHLRNYSQLDYCFMHGDKPFIFNAENYHRLIRNNSIQEVTAALLDGETAEQLDWPDHKETVKRLYKQLAYKSTLDVFMAWGFTGIRLQWRYGGWLYLHQLNARDGYFLLNSPMYEILDELISQGKITIEEDQQWNGVFHYDPVIFIFKGVKFKCYGNSIEIDGIPASREIIFKDGENPACEFSIAAKEKFQSCYESVYEKNCKNLSAQGDQA